MRIALCSDIHDHITHLLLALETARSAGCTHLLFMGDMAELSTFRTLLEEWGHPIDLVFGNNEYHTPFSFLSIYYIVPQARRFFKSKFAREEGDAPPLLTVRVKYAIILSPHAKREGEDRVFKSVYRNR